MREDFDYDNMSPVDMDANEYKAMQREVELMKGPDIDEEKETKIGTATDMPFQLVPASGDTFPDYLKEFYRAMKEKRPPDLMKHYQAVGFDAFDGLVKFNMEELTKLVTYTWLELLTTLRPDTYPANIQPVTLTYDQLHIGMNNLVWDLTHGTLLKVVIVANELDYRVVKAIKGFKQLSYEEIVQIYGYPPTFKNLFPETMCYIVDERDIEEGKKPQWTLNGAFDQAKIPLICYLTELIDAERIARSYLDMAFDIF